MPIPVEWQCDKSRGSAQILEPLACLSFAQEFRGLGRRGSNRNDHDLRIL
jgi:hypothetical protein